MGECIIQGAGSTRIFTEADCSDIGYATFTLPKGVVWGDVEYMVAGSNCAANFGKAFMKDRDGIFYYKNIGDGWTDAKDQPELSDTTIVVRASTYSATVQNLIGILR